MPDKVFYKEQIQKILNEKSPKIVAQYIKKNETILWNEILSKTSHVVSGNTMEHIRSYMEDRDSNICQYGNTQIFRDGKFRFCGRSSICNCAKESVSNSVSKNKSSRSIEDIKKENKKREETILKKSGGLYSNNGQSPKAKQAHKDFYIDKDNVKSQIEKQENTMMELYGVKNISQTEERKLEMRNNNCMKNKDTSTLAGKNKSENFDRRASLDMYYDRHQENLFEKNLRLYTSKEEYNGVADNKHYEFECLKCGNIFDSYFNSRNLTCKICNPTIKTFKSKQENEVFSYINKIDSRSYQGDRSIINPYEIDIVIPDLKIGIEYCGLYWHSEMSSGKNRYYHRDKMQKMNEKNYRLITIFSDEWINKKDVLVNYFHNLLGKESIKVNARQCKIQLVSEPKEQRKFYNENHLQGYTPGEQVYGLYYYDELVSLMSFGKGRSIMNRSTNDWEIRRFASKYNVRGAASKLLNHFKKQNITVKKLISDCDLRYGNGNLYDKLGFRLDNTSKPNYFYVGEKYTKRFNRSSFTKHKLVEQGYNPNKTEWEIMQELGYDRIWDCGNRKYILEW